MSHPHPHVRYLGGQNAWTREDRALRALWAWLLHCRRHHVRYFPLPEINMIATNLSDTQRPPHPYHRRPCRPQRHRLGHRRDLQHLHRLQRALYAGRAGAFPPRRVSERLPQRLARRCTEQANLSSFPIRNVVGDGFRTTPESLFDRPCYCPRGDVRQGSDKRHNGRQH